MPAPKLLLTSDLRPQPGNGLLFEVDFFFQLPTGVLGVTFFLDGFALLCDLPGAFQVVESAELRLKTCGNLEWVPMAA